MKNVKTYVKDFFAWWRMPSKTVEEPPAFVEEDMYREISIINKEFDINYSKVRDLGDVIRILKAMNLRVTWHQEECPEQFKDIYRRGLLKERTK